LNRFQSFYRFAQKLTKVQAEVVLTPKETAVPGALAKAKEIVDKLNGKGIILQQFENEANAKIHRETTGPEVRMLLFETHSSSFFAS
jgi:cysteine synthase